MPRQLPPYKIGLFDGYIYYHNKHGYFIRKHVKPAAQKLKGEKYAAVRKNNDEFAVAATAGKVIRDAFNAHTLHIGRGEVKDKLHGALQKALQGRDAGKGKPVINRKVLSVLRRFQWCQRHQSSGMLVGSNLIAVDREQGAFEVLFNSFRTELLRKRSATATHFRIQAVLTAIDFEGQTYKTVSDQTGLISFDTWETGDFLLGARLGEPPGERLLLLGFGVTCYTMAGERAYELTEDSGFELVDV